MSNLMILTKLLQVNKLDHYVNQSCSELRNELLLRRSIVANEFELS